MTRNEFIQRAQVEVSEKEYAAIEVVYMASDLDKDEFCKMWRKMNSTRVQNAKMERMIENRRKAQEDALLEMLGRWEGIEGEPRVYTETTAFVNAYEATAINSLKIKSGFYMTETIYNVRQYFKQTA